MSRMTVLARTGIPFLAGQDALPTFGRPWEIEVISLLIACLAAICLAPSLISSGGPGGLTTHEITATSGQTLLNISLETSMKTLLSSEKTKNKVSENATVSNEMSKIGIYTIAIAAGIIGCWAVVCLIAGMINSGGPLQLLGNLFSAITR